MKNRSIPLCIILSIVTCGIYLLYWLVVLTDDLNYASGRDNDTIGALAVVLSIVTCGIYGIYWAYKMGEKVDIIRGTPGQNTNLIYLLLELFGFNIIVCALCQSELNKCVPIE